MEEGRKILCVLAFFTIYSAHFFQRVQSVGTFSISLREGGDFCYDEDWCGPTSDFWPGACQVGKSQSPLDLVWIDGGEVTDVHVSAASLEARSFFIQNTGHSLSVRPNLGDEEGFVEFFPGEGHGLLPKKYLLHNIHFHWGANDSVGSEHTIEGKAFALEAQLTHYDADFTGPAAALASGNDDAIAVISFLFEVNKDNPHSKLLAPIIRNIVRVYNHSHPVEVVEELDLVSLIPQPMDKFFSYDGSLTTPECQEQVKWFVFPKAFQISQKDVMEFRAILDHNKEKVLQNYRPVQPSYGNRVKQNQVVSPEYHDIEPVKVTNWGDWGPMVTCSHKGHLVQAYKVKNEASQYLGDDTALNAIRFYCGDPAKPNTTYSEELISLEGPWGNWGGHYTWKECGGKEKTPYFTGIRMAGENMTPTGDDTGTSGVALACGADSWLWSEWNFGKWRKGRFCNWGYAICGLQTQVESYQYEGDDTALNRIRIRCCKIH